MYYGPRTPASFFAKVTLVDPALAPYYPQIVDIITRVLQTDTGSKLVGFLDPNKEIKFVTNDDFNAFHIPEPNSVTFSYDMRILSCYMPPDSPNSVMVPIDLQELVVHELIHVSGLGDHVRGFPAQQLTPQAVLSEIQAVLPTVPTGTSQSWNVKYANVVKAEMHALDVLNNPPNGIHPISPPRGAYGITACPVTDDKQLWLQQAATVPGWFVFNYNPATVTLLSGDTTGTVKVLYAGNSSPVVLSVVADQPIVIPSLNISKDSLVDLRGVVEAVSAQWQSNYQEMVALNEMTPAEEVLYKSNVASFGDNLKSLFASYLEQDDTGTNAFVDSRTFAQSIINWTAIKLYDFGSSTTELQQIDHLQQNVFSMYGDLAVGLQTHVTTNAGTLAYNDLTTIKQRFADYILDIAPIYTQAVANSAPNLASLTQSYKTMLNHVASGYTAILDSFIQAPGMTEQDKLFTTYGLYASMVGDLAFVLPDANLGLDGSALSAQLSNGLDLTATTMASLVGSLKESLAGYQLLVGEDIAMASLVEGGVNADSLAGTSANNLIFGYGSSDFVDGNSGNDVIFGGPGNDTLLGDLGVDTVYGGDGDDELWAGGDEVEVGEILDGGAGNNTLVVWDAKLQNATLSNLQTMWINDYVTLTAAQFAQFSSVNGDATIIAASAGTYDLSEKTVWYGVLNLQGSSGNDYLAGDGEGQTITGGAGNDALQGNGGADTLLGGDGDDDFLTGFSESPTGEVMNGGAGSNRISSWNANLSAATISNVQTLGAHLDYVTLTAAQLGGFNTLIAYGSSPITLNAASAGSYSLAGKTLTGAFNLNGSTGSDTLAGGTGAQTLSGGTGNDTYLQVRGGGTDIVVENDATSGNTDVLQFASDVARDQLWFTQSGNDLMVQIIGTTDSVTVKDWYLGSANHTEQIKAAGGTNTLLDSQVQNLVNAMAGFAVPSTTTLSSAYHTALDPVIAANWT